MKIRRGILAVTIALLAVVAPSAAQAAPPVGDGCKGGPWLPIATELFATQGAAIGFTGAAATDANGNGVVCVNTNHPPTTARYFTTARDDDCSVVPCATV